MLICYHLENHVVPYKNKVNYLQVHKSADVFAALYTQWIKHIVDASPLLLSRSGH